MQEPERAVDPTLTKEFQKLFTAASKCAEVRSETTMHDVLAWPCMCLRMCLCMYVHVYVPV